MKEVKWTEEQLLAINEKNKNILVAAAAGSGKTAVLVERIVNKIINEKVDIDKILVVTFTKAAAAEMRARILDAIYKKIEENPQNTFLQKQITLISKASICTIDAFCLDIVKNNFFEIDIPSNMKIAETTEIEILKQEVLEDVFEEKYEEEDKDFLKLIDMYTNYKGDDILQKIVLDIYNFIQSMPFPEEWLEEKIKMFDIKEDVRFEETEWGKILFKEIKEELKGGIFKLNNELNKIKYEENTEKFIVMLEEDMRKINEIYEKDTWDDIYIGINNLTFDRFPVNKNVPDEIKDKLKKERNIVKDNIKKITKNIMLYDSKEALEDIRILYDVLLKIQRIITEFSLKFSKAKLDRNIMDFNDIEHFALNILKSSENACENYKEKFTEILIDEYQDSNLVQEYILNMISTGNNIFMVGDVKQSIYKFRQARPELFLSKYEEYKMIDELKEGNNLKIKLFKNFRSRKNVLDVTNNIFDNIMSKRLGSIEYDKEEFLNLGASYEEQESLNTEVHIIDLKEQEGNIYKTDIEDNKEEYERVEDIVVEAKFVATKIKEIIDNEKYMITNKDGTKRKATYKDIALLLRSPQSLAPIYEQEISKLNLPVFCDTGVRILRYYRDTSYNECFKNNR